MKVLVDTSDLYWEYAGALKNILNVQTLPKYIIIESVEEA